MTEIAPPLPREPGPAPALARAEASGAAYAALDLGTNNCRLLIASPSQAGFRVLDSFSRIVRLGEGLGNSGLLSSASMDRALAALAACAEKLSRRPLRGFDAVATEACRQARNGPDFIARVEAEIGIKLRIISGREEAELAMESCAPLLGDGDHVRPARAFIIRNGHITPNPAKTKGKPSKSPNARFPA